MRPIVWSIKDIIDILLGRRENEFDGNVLVSGDRGNGKSTLINKCLYRIKGFRPWKHQVYDREAVIRLLSQYKGVCWDDEAVNSGYKRDFQQKGQKELIKIITAYRDNFTIYFSAIPNFFSLDKDLRDLVFLHLHVIERGIAIVHMPLQGRLYSQDRWDAKYNAKIEDGWGKKIQKNPNFRPPYHKLTTFRGYLYFGDVTERQKKIYLEVKHSKRGDSFGAELGFEQQLSFIEKVKVQLLKGKLTSDGLLQICLHENKKYTNVLSHLGKLLKDEGDNKTPGQYFRKDKQTKQDNKHIAEIEDLVPSF